MRLLIKKSYEELIYIFFVSIIFCLVNHPMDVHREMEAQRNRLAQKVSSQIPEIAPDDITYERKKKYWWSNDYFDVYELILPDGLHVYFKYCTTGVLKDIYPWGYIKEEVKDCPLISIFPISFEDYQIIQAKYEQKLVQE